jgi:hypothetical protein
MPCEGAHDTVNDLQTTIASASEGMPATSIKAGLVQAPRGMGDNRETNVINHFGFAHEALNLGVYPGANRIQRVPKAFPAIVSQIGKAPGRLLHRRGPQRPKR